MTSLLCEVAAAENALAGRPNRMGLSKERFEIQYLPCEAGTPQISTMHELFH